MPIASLTPSCPSTVYARGMTWMTWRSEATLMARLASTTRWTSSSPISWSGRATATTPVEFCDQRWVPASETTTDSMRWPALRAAVTAAAWMAAIVLSRFTTTPLRRPSEGLSPTPMMVTGVPGSSASPMTTATRLVPRSRPTVFFRLDKTVLGCLLERKERYWAGCRDYKGSRALAGPDFVGRGWLGGTPCGFVGLVTDWEGGAGAGSVALMRAGRTCAGEGLGRGVSGPGWWP